jgi:hypothetical protein
MGCADDGAPVTPGAERTLRGESVGRESAVEGAFEGMGNLLE